MIARTVNERIVIDELTDIYYILNCSYDNYMIKSEFITKCVETF
jgi:hypothetical protein